MKKAEIEEMDRLRAAVDRLTYEARDLHRQNEMLREQALTYKAQYEALQDLTVKLMNARVSSLVPQMRYEADPNDPSLLRPLKR